MSETSNNYITLESHYYGLSGAAIKYQTRNSCAESTGRILERIGHILFPGEEVQVYVLPAEDGCHLDRFWIKAQESPIAATGVLVTFFGTVVILPGQISQIITDTSTRSLNESQIRTNDSQEELNRLQAEALKSDLDERLGNNSVTTEQCLAVVENAEIRRGKNKLFRQLHSDSEINSEKFVAKSGNEVITEIDIHREQFESYIEPIVNEESEVVIEVSAIIEIIGPITRQSQSGHGIKWKGLYHGEDLTYQERVVLSAAEAIEFYMQDDDFKKQISEKDVVFASGDNMQADLRIKFMNSDSLAARKKIYVTTVSRFNQDEIVHQPTKRSDNLNGGLLDGIE